MNNRLKTLIQALMEETNEIRGIKDAQLPDTEWWMQIDWKTPAYKELFGSLGDETREMIIDAGLCPECGEDAPKSEAERAMSHFKISEEEWGKLSDEEKQEYINKLPEKGSGESEDKVEDVAKTNPVVKPKTAPAKPKKIEDALDPREVLKRATKALEE